MESYLFADVEAAADTMVVEGYHKPGSLTRSSGAWIHAAGTAMFEAGRRPIKPHDQWIWFAVEAGEATLVWQGHELTLKQQETCFLPAGNRDAALQIDESVRCVWIALEGPLAPMVVRKMGALLHMPLKQGALPSQMYLAKQIVQVIVRHTDTSDATYQLQHLMYGMLASHWGQPVAMDAMLSHEIAKVVDTLRANQYKDNFSLAEMAAISRMPMETFRKRFVSEVGMPPLSYVLHCKMERAKELLREEGHTVRQAGIEVGMQDPYHFSKQFKNIVGISPSAFMKQAAKPDATIRGSSKVEKNRAAGSPFQAKSSQEQKEQWIWWQCQRDTVPPEEKAPPVNALPEREAPPMPVPVQPTRHQQYDAIMQRMKVAQGRTGAFTSCGTSTQDSSGK